MLSDTDAACVEANVEAGPRVPNAEWPGPLFLVGMPRSGTKLLRGLLNQHPRIRVPDIETDFFPFLVRWVGAAGPPRTAAAFESMFAELRSAPYFSHRRSDRPEFSWRAWHEHCQGCYTAAGLFEGFIRYEMAAAGDSGLIWGDKSPAYIRHIGLLLEHFPTARVIHIIRDVRDYSASIRRAWNKDVRRAAFQWGQHVAAAHLICENSPRCIEIKYEDLLQSPEPQVRRLCRFLGIDFADAMMALRAPTENRGETIGRAEIVRDNFHKFTERLTRAEIRDIESLAWESMKSLGYEPLYAERQRTPGKLELRLRRLKDGANLAWRAMPRLGVLGALRFHLSHGRLTS